MDRLYDFSVVDNNFILSKWMEYLNINFLRRARTLMLINAKSIILKFRQENQ